MAELVFSVCTIFLFGCRQTLTMSSPDLLTISSASNIMLGRWVIRNWITSYQHSLYEIWQIYDYNEPVCPAQVLYDVKGILEKNRDTFRDDILNMLKDSRQDIQTHTYFIFAFLLRNVYQIGLILNIFRKRKLAKGLFRGMMLSVCLCNSLRLSCPPD